VVGPVAQTRLVCTPEPLPAWTKTMPTKVDKRLMENRGLRRWASPDPVIRVGDITSVFPSDANLRLRHDQRLVDYPKGEFTIDDLVTIVELKAGPYTRSLLLSYEKAQDYTIQVGRKASTKELMLRWYRSLSSKLGVPTQVVRRDRPRKPLVASDLHDEPFWRQRGANVLGYRWVWGDLLDGVSVDLYFTGRVRRVLEATSARGGNATLEPAALFLQINLGGVTEGY
jgi:hypothetical protein